MKQLILMRHGEAEIYQTSDFFRKLTPYGLKQADEMGNRILNMGLRPDAILCSNAYRTLMTARNVAQALNYPVELILEAPEIYQANTRTFLEIINAADDLINILLIIGHNPTISNMISYLSQEIFTGLQPASLAHLTVNVDRWAYISMGNADLVTVLHASAPVDL